MEDKVHIVETRKVVTFTKSTSSIYFSTHSLDSEPD